MKQLWARFQRTQVFRAWTRFGDARGNVLASGIAYYGFFAIFPAVAIAAVIFGFVLRGRPELLASVADSLNQTLPNFVKTADNPNGLVALRAPAVSVLTIGGLVAAVSLVLSGVGWIGAMRDGIRAIFGVPGSPGNLITDKLRDLGVLALLGVGVLVTGVLTSILGSGASGLVQWVGMGRSPLLVTVVGLIVGFVVDVAVMVLLLRFLSGVPLPWHDVRKGALAGAVGLSVIRLFGVQLVSIATRNPIFGSIVLVIGLLFWLNLIARVILLAASLAANDIDDHLAELEASSGSTATDEDVREHRHPNQPVEGRAQRLAVAAVAAVPTSRGATDPDESVADGADLTDERSRVVAGVPAFGARTQDRASLAAGAILGATVAFALGSVGRTIRSVFNRR